MVDEQRIVIKNQTLGHFMELSDNIHKENDDSVGSMVSGQHSQMDAF